MRLLIAIAATAGLAGCVAYGGGTYATADGYYTQGYPAYGTYGAYGGTVYAYPDGSRRAYRDRDRDGVPNRYDRDRDGDGVPNRRDAAPNDPRRY